MGGDISEWSARTVNTVRYDERDLYHEIVTVPKIHNKRKKKIT